MHQGGRRLSIEPMQVQISPLQMQRLGRGSRLSFALFLFH